MEQKAADTGTLTPFGEAQRLVDRLPFKGNISDGYHTFDELYEHRIVIYIAMCKGINLLTDLPVWKSKKHSDGSVWDGWFLLGIHTEQGEQITYHLPESKWNDCNFAKELDCAPFFDGHTSADVLKRIASL